MSATSLESIDRAIGRFQAKYTYQTSEWLRDAWRHQRTILRQSPAQEVDAALRIRAIELVLEARGAELDATGHDGAEGTGLPADLRWLATARIQAWRARPTYLCLEGTVFARDLAVPANVVFLTPTESGQVLVNNSPLDVGDDLPILLGILDAVTASPDGRPVTMDPED